MHFIRGGTDADSSYVSGNRLPGCTLDIRMAPIHEVKVNRQVFVYLKGGLADSCTTVHELKTERKCKW